MNNEPYASCFTKKIINIGHNCEGCIAIVMHRLSKLLTCFVNLAIIFILLLEEALMLYTFRVIMPVVVVVLLFTVVVLLFVVYSF